MEAEKVCTSCKQSKPLDAFGKDSGAKDGLRYNCRQCRSDGRKVPTAPSSMIPVVARECRECREHKMLTEFALKPSGKYGRMARCKLCVNAARRGRRTAENRQDVTVRVQRRVWRLLHDEAEVRGVPTSWLADLLMVYAIRELRRGRIILPASAPRKRHKDASRGAA